MIFEISRTSEWSSETQKPCEEAFQMQVPKWHVRTCTEEEYDKRFAKSEGGKWREIGEQHHVTEDGFITRHEGTRPAWVVSLNTLEELVDFFKKHGNLILRKAYDSDGDGSGLPAIEIYDDYRE